MAVEVKVQKPRLADEPAREPRGFGDDLAYLAPMGVFMLFTLAGTRLPALYPALYAAKTVVVAGLLVYFWRQYTPIRWNYWWLGVILGVVGIFQWVPMQLFLQQNFKLFKPPAADELFDPTAKFASPALMWAFIGVRLVGATLVVPVMEELFWRDYLWRRIIAPNDFKLAGVGEWDWKAFVATSLLFAIVHGNWWLTSIVWGFMVAGLLAFTRSLGACIIMHGVTNLLLGLYVLKYRDWAFW